MSIIGPILTDLLLRQGDKVGPDKGFALDFNTKNVELLSETLKGRFHAECPEVKLEFIDADGKFSKISGRLERANGDRAWSLSKKRGLLEGESIPPKTAKLTKLTVSYSPDFLSDREQASAKVDLEIGLKHKKTLGLESVFESNVGELVFVDMQEVLKAGKKGERISGEFVITKTTGKHPYYALHDAQSGDVTKIEFGRSNEIFLLSEDEDGTLLGMQKYQIKSVSKPSYTNSYEDNHADRYHVNFGYYPNAFFTSGTPVDLEYRIDGVAGKVFEDSGSFLGIGRHDSQMYLIIGYPQSSSGVKAVNINNLVSIRAQDHKPGSDFHGTIMQANLDPAQAREAEMLSQDVIFSSTKN